MTTADDADRRPRRRLLTWGLPMVAVAIAAVAVVAGVRAVDRSERSAAGDSSPDSSRSSTIAWSADGKRLWATSPDDDRVVELDPGSLEVVGHVSVEGQPRELTVLDDRVIVTGAQSTDLTILDVGGSGDGGAAVRTVPIPCGGSRAVVTVPSGDRGPVRDLAVVTCPTDDRLVVVDLERGVAVGIVGVPGRPTGIVRSRTSITVSTARDGHLRTFDWRGLQAAADREVRPDDPLPALDVQQTSSVRARADGGRTASTLGAVDTGLYGPVGVYQVVDNQRELTREEIEAGSTYGSPKDGRARLEPAIAGSCGARFSSLTDEARRLSGPVAVAVAPDARLVWVVGEFSHSVSVVRCEGGAPSERSETVATFAVGEGARGIVLSADGRRAFVDVGFDHEIAELRLPDGVEEASGTDPIERQDPARVGRRTVEDRYLSPLAQQGRRMFNDATNTHLTPFGVVTCGSCHPSAGEDGLSWRIETSDAATKQIERKVRRTPPAWLVDPDVKPLHWDGEFTSTDDLSLTTIQELLGGDGLLVDTAAISAYLAEVQAPPNRPGDDGADGDGDELLAALGCATCHSGEAGTDGKAHDVLDPSAVPDGDLDAVITPSLRAIRGRAPYGHDGRAADLEALLDAHGDGQGGTISLTPEERAAVLAYLGAR